jgi:predicted regulator of Ras-like GTPase activity (Roadblock/LC7/MglB family)
LEDSIPETLDDLLKKLLDAIPEVKAAVIVSTEGLPLASALPKGVDETRIAAMTAALLSLSERAILEMNQSDFDQLTIKGSSGYLLIFQAGPGTVLLISTTQDVRLDHYFRSGLTRFLQHPPGDPGNAGASGLVDF